MKITKIYYLKCPIDLQIKYVGKTVRTLESRLGDHISHAFTNLQLEGKNKWIRDLINSGHNPIINLIEECEENWKEAEIFWIAEYSKTNILFNRTKGGEDGVFEKEHTPWNKGGGYYSEETRRMMSVAKLGKKQTEEHIRNAAKDRKGSKRSESFKQKISEIKREKIIQYSLDGDFERLWDSITEASKFFSINTTVISQCCLGKYKTAANHIFRHFTDNYPHHINVDLSTNTRQIEQINELGDIIIHKNTKEARQYLRSTIPDIINLSDKSIECCIRASCNKLITYRKSKFKFINKQ